MSDSKYPVDVVGNDGESITVSYSDGTEEEYYVYTNQGYLSCYLSDSCPGYLTYVSSDTTLSGHDQITNYWYTYTEAGVTSDVFLLYERWW